jgi:phosphoribosyl 1,2-cyclic phosphodiesterase
LGLKLLSGGGRGLTGHILISHTHWDHIQGVPFFAPFFVPGNKWDIYGPNGLNQSLRDTLAGQMQRTSRSPRMNSAHPSVITTCSKERSKSMTLKSLRST